MNVMGVTNLLAAATMPEERLIKSFTEVEVSEDRLKHFNEAMKMLGIDMDAITEGWDEKEKTLFSNVLQLWVSHLHELTDAYVDDCVFVLVTKHFLIPTLEKKKALEKMLTLTGKEEG